MCLTVGWLFSGKTAVGGRLHRSAPSPENNGFADYLTASWRASGLGNSFMLREPSDQRVL